VILIDTSVWVDHFRVPDEAVARLIRTKTAAVHPFVLGELIMGNLLDWQRTVEGLRSLPEAEAVGEDDFITFVADQKLQGSGVGFVDAHLLASCRLGRDLRLWCKDKRLGNWAESLGVAWSP